MRYCQKIYTRTQRRMGYEKMMLHLCTLILLSVYTVSGQSVEIGILRDDAPTLRYLKGDCSWRLTIGNLLVDNERGNGSNFTLIDPDDIIRYILKCVVEETVKLTAIVSLYYDISEIPPPTLDIEKSTLKWSHSFQPNLTQDFVLIQNTTTIQYTVYMTDKDNINTTLLSNTTSNSIDISDIIENCTGKNFNVKALISNNQLHSETSSSIIIFSVPVFQNLSAYFLSNYSVHVIFELKTKCLSVFNITIEDNSPLLFNITSSDIERGEMIFDLPDDIISSMLYDVCSVNAMISGSNHIGQSPSVDIQPPSDHECGVFSSILTTSTPTTTPTLKVPVVTTTISPSTSSSSGLRLVDIIAVTLVIIVMVTLTFIVILILIIRLRRISKVSVIPATGGEDIETVPMENNKAYSTVVPMKRNECYASVLRPLPVNTETIPDYEIIPS